MSRRACANLRGMTVVSHKTNLVGERSAPPDAAALRELARANIRAVDLDLVPSLDGTFWACHPAELQQATGVADAFAVTDAAVQASTSSMLPLPQLLPTSASLNISLMLELKGAERPLGTWRASSARWAGTGRFPDPCSCGYHRARQPSPCSTGLPVLGTT